jgi:DNA (cytosine-5)-methyltransferase 1
MTGRNLTQVGPRKKLTALSLFSGGGGLDLGFSAAGFKIGCSTDIDPISCQTLTLNKQKKSFYEPGRSIVADAGTWKS